MRRLPILLTVLAAAALMGAGAPHSEAQATEGTGGDTAKIIVTVTGIKDPKGALMIALFNEAGYEGGASTAAAAIPVTSAEASVAFADLAPGTYGIKLFHDVDGDQKMGTNPFGIPVEPYAFSNNAKGQFGPPKWPAAAFTVVAGETVHAIRLD